MERYFLNGEISLLHYCLLLLLLLLLLKHCFALLLSAMQQECSLVAFYLVGRPVGVTGTGTE